jgi:hypothetical protein
LSGLQSQAEDTSPRRPGPSPLVSVRGCRAQVSLFFAAGSFLTGSLRLSLELGSFLGFLPVPLVSSFLCFVVIVVNICIFLRQILFCSVAQAGLELGIFLPQPPKCWDHKRCHLAQLTHSFCLLTYLDLGFRVEPLGPGQGWIPGSSLHVSGWLALQLD